MKHADVGLVGRKCGDRAGDRADEDVVGKLDLREPRISVILTRVNDHA